MLSLLMLYNSLSALVLVGTFVLQVIYTTHPRFPLVWLDFSTPMYKLDNFSAYFWFMYLQHAQYSVNPIYNIYNVQ